VQARKKVSRSLRAAKWGGGGTSSSAHPEHDRVLLGLAPRLEEVEEERLAVAVDVDVALEMRPERAREGQLASRDANGGDVQRRI
jgi:hypothetical protein